MSEKYKSIKRLDPLKVQEMKEESGKYTSKEVVAKVVAEYLPLIKEITDPYTKYTNSSIRVEEGYNRIPHKLSVKVTIGSYIRFYLDELFHNCGILVSHDTVISESSYRGKGLSYILHCIKEDICYITGYSVLMYTDRSSSYQQNVKVLDGIESKEIFNFLNYRSSNQVTVRVKNVREIYDERIKEAKANLKAQPKVEPVNLTLDEPVQTVEPGEGIEPMIRQADLQVVGTVVTEADLRQAFQQLWVGGTDANFQPDDVTEQPPQMDEDNDF